MDKRALWKSRFLEKFQHTTGTKNNNNKNTSLDTLKWVQEIAWLYLHHTSSKAAQPKAKRDLSPLFVPRVKGRMCVYLASPPVQDTANRSPFSTHPEYRIMSYMSGRREKAGRATDRGLLEGIEGMWILLTAFRCLDETPTTCWECLTHGFLQLAHGQPPALHVTQSHPRRSGHLAVHTPEGSGEKSDR